MMASFSEGLLLSEKVGLDPNVLVEVNLIHVYWIFIFILLKTLICIDHIAGSFTGCNKFSHVQTQGSING